MRIEYSLIMMPIKDEAKANQFEHELDKYIDKIFKKIKKVLEKMNKRTSNIDMTLSPNSLSMV